MPIYEYKCHNCGVFEVTQRITENALKKCPTCKGKVERIISATSFVLKGSGWYATDYANKGKTDATAIDSSASTGAASDSSSNGSSDSAAKDAATKPAKSSEKSAEKSADSSKSAGARSVSAKADSSDKGASKSAD
ncbi:MAG TPA: zinc ribbon domain-containing protein [Candidatus Binataceae bacterium]|nr:zinc ribbon domain-containing protein [Candidatus Binataceae bacterium]